MVNAKKKGNHGENLFASFLREHGIKAYKEASSGAHSHRGDIVNNVNLTIEVKTVKKLNLKEAWEQVASDASMARNSPLLAIHLDGMGQGEWLCVMHSDDLVELLKLENNTQSVIDNDPRRKYAIQNMVESAKRVIKMYDV